MEQVPKIVRERLRAVQEPEVHPDADLLTAFAEKSLTSREHEQMLEHLAGCADCREVVAYAQPQPEVAYAVAASTASSPQPMRSWWSRATVLRWAALAASVIVVAGVVISRSRFSRNNEVAIKNESVQKIDTYTTAKIEPPPPAAPAVTAESKNEKDQRREFDKLSSAKTPHAADAISAEQKWVVLPQVQESRDRKIKELPANGRNVNELAQISPGAASPAAAPPPAPQSNNPEVAKKQLDAAQVPLPRSQNEIVTVEAEAVAVKPVPAQSGPVASNQAQRAQASTGLYKAKDNYGYAGISGGALAGKVALPTPRWQISPQGKLVRSTDAGDTWHPVPVGDDKVFLRALCVTGREVWVGGNQGNLFYSSDAGEHWEQLKPTANGQAVTADITAIEFKDAQHGSFTTSSHQTWTTSDGGHVWQVQSR